jgi:outer membrane receptor protein involved in Fe transport
MKSLQLSYGRRVDRPGLNQVNPVREFSTPRLTQVGNPELDPQFTNSVEFNYTQSFSKGNFTGGAFFRTIENEINQTIILDPEDPTRFILTYQNGTDNTALGVEISGSYKPVKWWSINPSAELYNKTERGVVGTELIEVDNTAFSFRLNQSFTATEKLTFQLFGLYRSPSRMLQFEAKEMYFINAGARYNILDNKGTLSLNFNDIFNTQQFAFETDRPVAQEGRFKPESQTVFLGFSYRFGSGKNSALKRKNRDANEKQGGGIFYIV